MREVSTLVSWDSPEDLGKIPGSEWVCPVGRVDRLGAIENSGGTVTDELIREHAKGRPQHLSLIQFPEGYHAAMIIDSETGEQLADTRASYRYDGLISCDCGAIHNTPAVTAVLSGRSIDLPDDRQVAGLYNANDGSQTVVHPTKVSESEPDYISRLRTAVHVTPQSNRLYITTEGKVESIDNCYAQLDIQERDSKIEGKLLLWVSDDWNTGQVNIVLDPNGRTKELKLHELGFLKVLGVGVDSEFDHNGWAEVTDPKQQDRILDATAEALGFEAWQGLDLRLTASGLYAALGRRNLDPASILVPRS